MTSTNGEDDSHDDSTDNIGARIFARRDRFGLSQSQLAARLARVSGNPAVTRHDVSRWERGTRRPDWWLPHLENVLGELTEPEPMVQLDIDRDRLAHVADRPRAVDHETLDALGTVLASTRRLEDRIGAVAVLRPVTGHLDYVELLAAEARGDIRPAVVDQAGQWAQYIGWLHIATQRYPEADRWLSRSLEWATEAQDDDLSATVWSFKGHLAWLLGNLGPTIGLTQVARRYRGVYAGQTAYDALQEARGHAAIGDAYATERLVDESHELARRALAELPGAPPWHYYRTPAFWDLERGRAFARLPGGATKAIEHLSAGLAALPADQVGADWVKAYRRDLAGAQRVV